MGYLIDVIYICREAFKLISLVLITPLGLAASYLFTW